MGVGGAASPIDAAAVSKSRPDTGDSTATSTVLGDTSHWSIVHRESSESARDVEKRKSRKRKEPAHVC